MSARDPDLCVVVPAHDEEANLPLLHAELVTALQASGIDFRILVVDDGSRDGTPAILRRIVAADRRVAGLRLSRNFGHQAAISIGLAHARARAVAIMDADLQDRPDDLVRLYRTLQDGWDVAYATRRSRREGPIRRMCYRAYYRILSRVANIPIPVDAGDFCVMTVAFVDRLNALPERLRFVRGLRAWLGGRQIAVPVDRDARRSGRPQYTLARLLRLASDGVFSFSDAPLRIASIVGFLLAGFALIGVLVVLGWKASGMLPSGAGAATIALGVFFFAGVQLLSVGLLGEYVGRIFDEVKRRPVGIVAEHIGSVAATAHPTGVISLRDRHGAVGAR